MPDEPTVAPAERHDLAIARVPARRVELGPGSWFEVVDGFVRQPADVLARVLEQAPWEQNEVLRYDRYVPEQRLSCGLRADTDPVLRQTELHLRSAYRQVFTGVAAILYRDGDDFQGMHSDREMRWLDETLIAIVVLGARRPFVFRPRAPMAEVTERVAGGRHPDDIVITPGEGDLLVMGGACQRDWLHGVPRADGVRAPRVSLTWRWTSRRGRPDTNPGYFDGRQFSDRQRQPGTRTRRP